MMKRDINNSEDIIVMVDSFYYKVREDEILKDIFENIIQDRWDVHLEKMYKFWETVVLNKHTYFGSPFSPHVNMPVNKTHFNRWIEIFVANIDELYEGDKTEETKNRAKSMAKLFNSKLEYYRENNNRPIL